MTAPESAPRPVRLGVIGTGMGAIHIDMLGRIPAAEVAGVCSAQRSHAEAVAARFGVPLATDQYVELLEAELDAVIIATPPPLHAPMALAAIERGLHIFCEKPLASSLTDARRMRDAARAAGVVHAVGYNLRYAAPFVRAHELAAEGYLGRLVAADCLLYFNPVDYLRSPAGSSSKSGWYTDAGQSGGMLGSATGPHQIDMLQWFGGPIEAVTTQTAISRPVIEFGDGERVEGITAEDTFVVLVRYASGALATIRGLPIPYHGFGFELDLIGTEGSLALDFDRLRGATGTDRGFADLPLPGEPPSERVAILEHFIDAIRSGDPAVAAALPNFDDGVAAQAVLDACFTAARERSWVRVDRK